MKIKAVLLDFDGTIINSQPTINGYFFSILEHKGLHLSEKERESIGGVSIDHILEWLKFEKKFQFSKAEIFFHKAYFWLFKMHEIRPFPGAIKLLEQLLKENIKMAIVTNSPRKYTKQLLTKNHLRHYFDTIVSIDDAGVAKPNPKMLGMAATKLGVSYKHCIMIDDNEPGILAAKALGIRNILIKNNKHMSNKNFAGAHRFHSRKENNLADITLPKIEQSIKFILQ